MNRKKRLIQSVIVSAVSLVVALVGWTAAASEDRTNAERTAQLESAHQTRGTITEVIEEVRTTRRVGGGSKSRSYGYSVSVTLWIKAKVQYPDANGTPKMAELTLRPSEISSDLNDPNKRTVDLTVLKGGVIELGHAKPPIGIGAYIFRALALLFAGGFVGSMITTAYWALALLFAGIAHKSSQSALAPTALQRWLQEKIDEIEATPNDTPGRVELLAKAKQMHEEASTLHPDVIKLQDIGVVLDAMAEDMRLDRVTRTEALREMDPSLRPESL